MSFRINKVAVIGSGVMGASIAAHVANSGTEVVLLDIVPKDAKDRSQLAKGAIERLLKTDPAPLTHKRKAKLIIPGNLEDDLSLLSDVDWIIEVVLEDLEIKRDLYKIISEFKKTEAVVSSNTSTIPLHLLIEEMPIEFNKHFMVTHFFNPPRYMRLLELVVGEHTSADIAKVVREFCDVKLGKGVVDCKDTPGFIANRIGCYWMTVGVLDAMDIGITVEEADLVMGRPVGIPKTGIFGLLDLIGIDLMPLIAKEFSKTLPETDEFIKIYKEPELVKRMISEGYTGRKGNGGFYRLNTETGEKIKEVIDLKTGEYSPATRPKLQSVEAAKGGLRKLIEHDDIDGKYGKAVLLKTLSYAASLVPEISDDIVAVDEAMKLGYNWKYGPFELIDKLGCDKVSGTKWLAEKLKSEGMSIPQLLEKAGDNPMYKLEGGKRFYITGSGDYTEIKVSPDAWMLADKKVGNKPILKNPSASLWDIGDGIACLEYTSKMNSVDPMILEMIEKSIEIVQKQYKGLVIANDSDNFCVGANIGVLLFAANVAAWKDIREIIKRGQDAYMALKFAPFPVVTAVSGMALGGGCEILMHSDAVQAHVETYTGLVEVGVGIVPGWGGCKEMLIRNIDKRLDEQTVTAKLGRMFSALSPIKTINTMPAIIRAFENIGLAKVAKSAEEAKDMLILLDKDSITMNRKRLLSDAKDKCLELVDGYNPPQMRSISLPGKTARAALNMAIDGYVKNGKATKYDEVVSKALATVLSGGNTDITKELTEQDLLNLELDVFMELVKNEGTLDRIEHMLETGKPLRN
ncbi:MAG: 3-hydroxyacyl-CoA dehydrogenase [Alphaproteobacteria bacterium CG11_big_fil_rev_8_21_14_0_20_39_49]|nr:MAG: 3-hydroxyacyl-CoA dehydrogenase [Alphaproteobacteria bacterium CG11_big_fil_rev_8_21_14_0_20_39_49]